MKAHGLFSWAGRDCAIVRFPVAVSPAPNTLDPMTTGIKSVSEIRSAMNKVIEIDPTYQNSSAYDALAQVELETRFTGGSAQKAAELIEKALETETHRMPNANPFPNTENILP